MPIEFEDFPAMFDNPFHLQTPDSGFSKESSDKGPVLLG